MRTPEEIIKSIVEKNTIKDVFFAACGGSLVDLYPGYYFISKESANMHAHWLPARELTVSPSRFLNEHALVIICSHSGNTPECVEVGQAVLAKHANVIAFTHAPGSAVDREDFNPIIYDWADDVNQNEKPQGIVMRILNELMKAQEPDYDKYEDVLDGLEKADGIVRRAEKKVLNRTWLFAEKYYEEPFLYIMASGASYSQAYGFSICSLQEMQWMNCCYLHSGEYFHGPFECTDENTLYILMKGTGSARVFDERAEVFLKKYARKYEIIDAEELGIGEIKDTVNEYFAPMLFYQMTVSYRTALQNKRQHPLDMRRYMGVVEY